MSRFNTLVVFALAAALASPAWAALARMPDLRQLSVLEAKAYLDQHDLSVLWTGSGEFIADQSPKPDKKIPDDRVITLTLRDPGPADPRVRFFDFSKVKPVPIVTGLPLGLARARLEAAGFRVQVVPPTRLAPEPKDINGVYEQEPAAGARVPRPAAVKISAYRTGYFRAPTVIGMTIEQAYTALKPYPVRPEYTVKSMHGVIYSPEELRSAVGPGLPRLPVVSQRPEPGGEIKPGAPLAMQARFDPLVRVPKVVGLPVRDAERELCQLHFRVHVRGDRGGVVQSLDPDPETMQPRCSLIYVQSDRERDRTPHVVPYP